MIKRVITYITTRLGIGLIGWMSILGFIKLVDAHPPWPEPPPSTKEKVIQACTGKVVKEYYEGFWGVYETMRCDYAEKS